MQPTADVPVTVYVVVVDGANATPFVTPLFHVYVEAPEPESVTEAPIQIT